MVAVEKVNGALRFPMPLQGTGGLLSLAVHPKADS